MMALAVAVGVVAPALVLGVLLTADLGPVLESEAAPAPIVVPVGKTTFDDRRSVLVRFTWLEGELARSGGLDGLVVAVTVESGDTLGTGDVVAEVGGVRVVALVMEKPFHRPLARGDEGEDVVRLERFLIDLGLLPEDHEPGGEVTQAVSAAIGVFNQRHGVQQVRRSSTGRAVGPEFDPAAVLWVGDAPFVVGTVLVEPGTRWPGLGEPVLRGPDRLDDARVFTLGEAGAPPTEVVLPGGYVLVIDEATVPLDDSGGIDADGRARLSALVPAGTTEVVGSVRLADPIEAVKVPPSAIVDGTGGECVYAEVGETGFKPVAVELVASLFGEAVVRVSAPVTEVLANPAQVIPGAPCS